MKIEAGQKLGHLTTIEPVDPGRLYKGDRKHNWRCVCDCGNEVVVKHAHLVHKQRRSCGCSQYAHRCDLQLDLTGRRLGRLTIVSAYLGPRPSGSRMSKGQLWNVRCDCGNEFIRNSAVQRRRSCGCASTRHGRSKRNGGTTQENTYKVWCGLKQRCNNKNNPAYADYGGRGIRVCDRWMSSFENFLADMGEKPSKEHSLDRIDVNGNYEPLNCRWASRVEQKANQRCSADRIRQLLDTFRRRDQKLIAELEIAIFGEGRVM